MDADGRRHGPALLREPHPELQITNPDLNADLAAVIEEADLDEEQQKKLDRTLASGYQLITRDDRLEAIAQDLVAHFMERGEPGKAMVVSVDKATAVRMYDKVRVHWRRYLDRLRALLDAAPNAHDPSFGYVNATRQPASIAPATPLTEAERERVREEIRYMEATDMAVIVSQSQNEIEDLRAKGLDITPHRRRMVTEDLEAKFKDSDDPLRLVFVCAMWMTGFDVPSLTPIYLDKPMRNHTLMQTIARANRVFRDKQNGLIVDYVGVFRDLQKALAIYGAERTGDDGRPGDEPIKDKGELIEELRRALAEAETFCRERGVDPHAIIAAQGFGRVALLDAAADAFLADDETKKRYFALATGVAQLYRAILPDPRAVEFTPLAALYAVIAAKMLSYLPKADIGEVLAKIERLLDESIAPVGYVIEAQGDYRAERRVDLSQIDFDALARAFDRGRKHIEAQKLRTAVSDSLARIVQLNRARMDYLARFQALIDAYNAGSMNVEVFFEKLLELARDLDAEDKRAIAEQLSEEELALFDLLTRPGPELSQKEREQVKKAARDLLTTLKREKLVLDWKKKQQTRADVYKTVRDILDTDLPAAYTPDVYARKCDEVWCTPKTGQAHTLREQRA